MKWKIQYYHFRRRVFLPDLLPKVLINFSMSSFYTLLTYRVLYRHHSKVGEAIFTHRVSEVSFQPPQGREATFGAARSCGFMNMAWRFGNSRAPEYNLW